MLRKMFAVYDDAVKGFMTPFFQHTENEAKRGFIDATRNTDKIKDFPKDYSLYHIGDFDDSTGVLTHQERPIPVMTAVEALQLAEKIGSNE